MTRAELKQRLRVEQVPEKYYSLDGGLPMEKWCLGHTESGWEVYYSERGVKTGLERFQSESDACDCFYQGIQDILRSI